MREICDLQCYIKRYTGIADASNFLFAVEYVAGRTDDTRS